MPETSRMILHDPLYTLCCLPSVAGMNKNPIFNSVWPAAETEMTN